MKEADKTKIGGKWTEVVKNNRNRTRDKSKKRCRLNQTEKNGKLKSLRQGVNPVIIGRELAGLRTTQAEELEIELIHNSDKTEGNKQMMNKKRYQRLQEDWESSPLQRHLSFGTWSPKPLKIGVREVNCKALEVQELTDIKIPVTKENTGGQRVVPFKQTHNNKHYLTSY